MRPNVREFLRLITETINLPEPIIEIGSFQVDGQEELADIRPFFSGKEFTGCDMRPGKGVDRIENVEHLSFPDQSAGSIICLDTLEHVRDIISARNEMFRVLKPGGFIIISSVMDHPIHDYPYDYWRFTPEAFKFLLANFAPNRIFYQGFTDFPHTVFGIGTKSGCDLESISIDQVCGEPLNPYPADCVTNIYARKTAGVYLLRLLRRCSRELKSLSLRLQYLEEKKMKQKK